MIKMAKIDSQFVTKMAENHTLYLCSPCPKGRPPGLISRLKYMRANPLFCLLYRDQLPY